MVVVMEHDRPLTVLEALATAGGANPTANLHNAKIIRKDENGTTKVPVDIREIMEAKAPDVALQADTSCSFPAVRANPRCQR